MRILASLIGLVTGALPPLVAQGVTGPLDAADSLRLSVTVLKAAIDYGIKTAYRAPLPRLICIGFRNASTRSDPSLPILDALARPDSIVLRPISACRVEPLRRPRDDTPLVVEISTGARGISVYATEPSFTGEQTFAVDLGYYEHGLSAAAWTCSGRRQGAGWEIVSCEMRWIS